MGREVRRVPVDFDWPIGELWDGFLMPKRLSERQCETCDGSGYSPEAEALREKWYSNGKFDPSETGSTPLTAETPEVRERAERNVLNAPEFYGTGETAIIREATRLAALFNGAWSHHLDQDDVDALIAADRLRDFTHKWEGPERRWQAIEPPITVTPEQVNLWSLRGIGHDSINCSIAVEARCAREGLPHLCSECEGHGSTERWPGQRAEAEVWEPVAPPTGDGWQLWNTTDEGSPMTPVFTTPEALAEHCETAGVSWFGHSTATREQWLSTFVGSDFVHVQIAPGVVIM